MKKGLSEMLKNLRDARKLPSEQRKPAMQSIDKSIHELLGNTGYKSWRADMQAKDKLRKAPAPVEQVLTSPQSAAPAPKKKSGGKTKSQSPPSATSSGGPKNSGPKRKLATAESVPLPAVEAAAQKKTK